MNGRRSSRYVSEDVDVRINTNGMESTQKIAKAPSNCVVVPALLGKWFGTSFQEGHMHRMQIETKFEP